MSCTRAAHIFCTKAHILQHKHTRKQNAKVHCEIERAIVIGTWGHTSDKVNKEKCTQLEPSNLFVETFEEKQKKIQNSTS